MDNSDYQPKNPNGDRKGRCNNILWNCKGEDCDYHYQTKDETHCPICNAQRDYCSAYPIKGREKCKFHGGMALIGASHPNYKGKGLSKHLPTRMMETLHAAIDDPDILNMSEDIGLLEALQVDLLRRLKEEEWGFGLWSDLQKEWSSYDKARRKANTESNPNARIAATKRMAEALEGIEKIIAKGAVYDGYLRDELLRIMDSKRKFKEAEKRRRKDAEDVVTREQFRTLLGYIVTSIKERVSDVDERMRVFADLENIRFG